MTAPGFSDNLRGAALMSASMLSFVINDTIMKIMLDDIPFYQAIFLRGIGATLCLVILARAMRSLTLRIPPSDRLLVLLRTLSEVAAAYFFIKALSVMPLANATAILQALPLTVTLAGAIFLREQVGWRRMTAILLGLVGVLLIIRPGPEGFTSGSVYALMAVLVVTIRDIATRRMSKDVPSLTVAVSAAVGVTIFAAIGHTTETWVPLTTTTVLLLLGSIASIFFAYICSVGAMRVGDISFSAAFRYTSMIWALLLGLLVFGDFPDPVTLVGALIVVASGLYTFYRERHRLRQKSAQ